MISDLLMYVAIFDGIVIGVIGVKFLLVSTSKKGVVTAPSSVEATKFVKPTKTIKINTKTPELHLEEDMTDLAKGKDAKIDGLAVLIAETRKNSGVCSVCSAYTSYFDSGKFKHEGMTSAGVISHLDAKHKAQSDSDV